MSRCLKRGIGVLSLFLVGCGALQTSPFQKRPNENVRLAQARLSGLTDPNVEGRVEFEQMPNSMIIILHLEGLKPKEKYRIHVLESGSCEASDRAGSAALLEFRSNKMGNAENTFKTEMYTVSGERPLLGSAILVASGSPSAPGRGQQMTPLACGVAEPQTADSEPH